MFRGCRYLRGGKYRSYGSGASRPSRPLAHPHSRPTTVRPNAVGTATRRRRRRRRRWRFSSRRDGRNFDRTVVQYNNGFQDGATLFSRPGAGTVVGFLPVNCEEGCAARYTGTSWIFCRLVG